MKTAICFSLMAAMAGVALAAPANAESKPQKAKDPNEVVCEKQEVLGSRLAKRKVCMTRSQWAEQRRSDRDLVQKSQVGVYQKNP
jgi:predicted secreted protein